MTTEEVKNALTAAGIENADGEAHILKEEFSGKTLESAVARRIKREPLQYIIGRWPFFREEYFVSPACLIPRSDTEVLVEHLVKTLPHGARFLDLCTGSGCIAISLKRNRRDTDGIAADISEEALAMARKNAAHNGADVTIVHADVTRPSAFTEQFDCIVSNPPYITDAAMETLAPELSHEPRIALCGGEDGMVFYRAILENFAKNLKTDGCFAFELGFDQRDAIHALANEHGYSVQDIYDYGGNFRAAILKRL